MRVVVLVLTLLAIATAEEPYAVFPIMASAGRTILDIGNIPGYSCRDQPEKSNGALPGDIITYRIVTEGVSDTLVISFAPKRDGVVLKICNVGKIQMVPYSIIVSWRVYRIEKE